MYITRYEHTCRKSFFGTLKVPSEKTFLHPFNRWIFVSVPNVICRFGSSGPIQINLFQSPCFWKIVMFYFKVHIFWEGHKILQNFPLTFDCINCSQKFGEDFAKFCGLLRIYELYKDHFLLKLSDPQKSLFGNIIF